MLGLAVRLSGLLDDRPLISCWFDGSLADREQALGVAQEWLYPRDIGSASYLGKPNETAEVTGAFEHLKQTGRTREVFDEFLGGSRPRRDSTTSLMNPRIIIILPLISVSRRTEWLSRCRDQCSPRCRRRERPVLPRQAGHLTVHQCSPRESSRPCAAALLPLRYGVLVYEVGVIGWSGRLEWSVGTDKDVGDHCPGQAAARRGDHGRVSGSAGGVAAGLGCAGASVQRVSRGRNAATCALQCRLVYLGAMYSVMIQRAETTR